MARSVVGLSSEIASLYCDTTALMAYGQYIEDAEATGS